MFISRDNDIGKKLPNPGKAKKSGNAKQWEGYDETDKKQADMEKGITPKKRKP
jgi:hypothetical protein